MSRSLRSLANSITYARDCFPCHGRLVGLTRSRCLSFNRALGYLQRVSGPQIFRESRRRIEDTTEPKKEEKKDGKQILCFRTKTAHIEQSLFDPIGPFSYVLSQMLNSRYTKEL